MSMDGGRYGPEAAPAGASGGSGGGASAGGLAGLCVRRPYLAAVINLLIVLAGIAALLGIEVRELPDIDRPIVAVRANYPGAAPITVDAEVTSKVEAAVARVSGITSIGSASEEGNFRLHAEFRPGRDLTEAANEIREAVARIRRELPDGVEDILIIKTDVDAWPIVRIAIWSEAGGLEKLTREVERSVIPELAVIDGVAEAQIDGARARVLRVAVRPDRLAAFGISIAEVAEALRAAQFDVPVGSFEAGQLEVLVRADATVAEPSRIEALMLREHVRLGEIADVFFGRARPHSISRLDGREVVTVNIVRQARSNTVEISDAVHAAISRLETRMPELRFRVIEDGAIFIRGATAEVLNSLVFALLIVVAVIWAFFGRAGATLVPAVAIPVALTGALAGIWMMGFSINLITLLALVLATGLVVDDAIVVTENIQRRRAEGLAPRAAAVIGTREVFFAVIATTATLISVFVPISFLPSEAGRLFREFGFVLAATVAISSFVALSLCPMIASRLPDLGREGGIGGPLGRWIGAAYALSLRPVIAAPLVALTLVGLAAASAVPLHASLGSELVPFEDRGFVMVRFQGPDGTGLDYTDRQVVAVERMFDPWIEAGIGRQLFSVTGRWDPNRGEIGMALVDWDEREVGQGTIMDAIRPQLDDLAGANGWVVGGNSIGLRGGGGNRLELALVGAQYPDIAEAAFAFSERLSEIPGVRRSWVEYQATQPQLSIRIDRRRAADLGVSMETLSSTLRALIEEDEVTELTIDDEAVPVLLQSSAGAVRDPADLLNLSVRAEGGALVPLSQLVTLHEEGVAAELDRHGQRRAVEVRARLSPELALGDAVAHVHAEAASLPPGIGYVFLGEAATLEQTSSDVALTLAIALLVVFMVLVAQFESVTSAVVVMVTVPLGLAAAVYALWLTGTTVNVFSQIGVLMLVGILAKNGILLVEVADQLRDRGYAPHRAAAVAARARLRAIAMTLASTVLAGLPLILSEGPGAEARAAIGWVIVGGLGITALITLYVTPAAYALIAGLSRPRAAEGERLEAELRAAHEPAE